MACDQCTIPDSFTRPPHLNVTIDVENLEQEAIAVSLQVRSDWSSLDVKVRVFTDGITNRLVGCFLEDDPDDVVLVRVYGENTQLFIDREAEKRNMSLMSRAGLAPSLFASFNNGLCYGFTPGTPIDGDMVRDPVISGLIACKMARMHFLCKTFATKDTVPWMIPSLQKYLSFIPERICSRSEFLNAYILHLKGIFSLIELASI